MEIAPVRQPGVRPAAPRMGRAWHTAAYLVAAALVAGAVMLPPFAAGFLFPGRAAAPSPGPHPAAAKAPPPAQSAVTTGSAAAEPGTPAAPNPIAADSGDNAPLKRDAPVETMFSDLPIAGEPANEPPRRTAPVAAPSGVLTSGVLTSGVLASGVFASRSLAEASAAADPATELALRPIPPLDTAAAGAPQPHPTISPPPARREPLPLQTDLLTAQTPGPQSIGKPDPAPSDGALPSGKDRHG